jgi:hypothetical protein
VLSPGDTESTCCGTAGTTGPAPATESNGLFYNQATDSFFYSFYTNNSLVEVDATTGASKWWRRSGREYDFDPASTQFMWQHGITITGDGTLLLSTKTDYTLGYSTDNGTSVREYEIDHADRRSTRSGIAILASTRRRTAMPRGCRTAIRST